MRRRVSTPLPTHGERPELASVNMEKEPNVPLRLVMAERNLERAQQCGDHLVQRGFKVINVSERGVDFEGRRDLAESTFQFSIDKQGDELRVKGRPEMPDELREGTRGVYVPTRPIFPT